MLDVHARTCEFAWVLQCAQLTLIVTREVAFTISAETPDARDFMLTLLDRWMTDRNVRVARVEVFYGRAHLATAQTRVFGGPTVEFH